MKSTKNTSGQGYTKKQQEEFDLVILGGSMGWTIAAWTPHHWPRIPDPLLAFFTAHAELRATTNCRGRFRMGRLHRMRNARL